jgi:hypothetical protein
VAWRRYSEGEIGGKREEAGDLRGALGAERRVTGEWREWGTWGAARGEVAWVGERLEVGDDRWGPPVGERERSERRRRGAGRFLGWLGRAVGLAQNGQSVSFLCSFLLFQFMFYFISFEP